MMFGYLFLGFVLVVFVFGCCCVFWFVCGWFGLFVFSGVCLYALIACAVLDLQRILVVGLIAICGLLLEFLVWVVTGCFSLLVCLRLFWFILFVVIYLFAA